MNTGQFFSFMGLGFLIFAELLVLTDSMEAMRSGRRRATTGIRVLAALFAVLGALTLAGGVFIYHFAKNP